MPESLNRKRSKIIQRAGAIADEVRIQPGRSGLTYRIRCGACVGEPRRWTTWRQGQENTYQAAMDRWILHIHRKHPSATAPCLADLEDAKERADAADSRRYGISWRDFVRGDL